MNPLTVLAAIAGGITGTFLFTLFGVGLVGVSSPGSIITIMMMASAGDQLMILISILASAAVSFLVASFIVKRSKQNDDDVNRNLKEAAKQMESLKGKKSRISSVFEDKASVFDYSKVASIVYVCDAGMGSSATVSYTHLDVYKRQLSFSAMAADENKYVRYLPLIP